MKNFPHIDVNKCSLSGRGTVYGVGINDADYLIYPKINGKNVRCPFYKSWKSMLERCYSRLFQDRHPAYVGCTVCAEWLTFSNFRAWMVQQDWHGKQLDKDIIKQGNKVYSPDTCCFVPQELNKLLNDSEASRGRCPVGVSWHNISNKYQARVNYNGKRQSLGLFNSPEAAHAAYKKRKSEIILEAATKQTDGRIVDGLLYMAKSISNG